MYATINGTRIFFDVEGMGYVPDGPIMRQKPVCFILHGGPGGDHTAYKPKLSALADSMQLVYIDNRGSGLTEKGPQSTYTLENNVADIEELRKHLGVNKIVILGQSYGGMTALEYAKKYPENLDGLLLVTTSPSYQLFSEGAKHFVARNGTRKQQEMVEVLFDKGFETDEELAQFYNVMGSMYSYTYNPKTATEDQKRNREHAQARSTRSREALNEGFQRFLKEYDVVNDLPSIKVPTLIIGGRHDWITPVEDSILMADKIPNNTLVIFENSSHSVLTDAYELFISTVSKFVNKHLVEG